MTTAPPSGVLDYTARADHQNLGEHHCRHRGMAALADDEPVHPRVVPPPRGGEPTTPPSAPYRPPGPDRRSAPDSAGANTASLSAEVSGLRADSHFPLYELRTTAPGRDGPQASQTERFPAADPIGSSRSPSCPSIRRRPMSLQEVFPGGAPFSTNRFRCSEQEIRYMRRSVAYRTRTVWKFSPCPERCSSTGRGPTARYSQGPRSSGSRA